MLKSSSWHHWYPDLPQCLPCLCFLKDQYHTANEYESGPMILISCSIPLKDYFEIHAVWSSFRIYANMLILIQIQLYFNYTIFIFKYKMEAYQKTSQTISVLWQKFSSAFSHYLMRNPEMVFLLLKPYYS